MLLLLLLLLIGILFVGALPQQIDDALKKRVGLAMGMFEMMDLAGGDIGWRQRKELGLTVKDNRESNKRYCCLPDKLCEKTFFGQKTSQGWYRYDPSAPRTPIVSNETTKLIHEHREAEVLSYFFLALFICNNM